MIRTNDADIAVSQMQRIPQKEVWLAFGTGKSLSLLVHLVHKRAQLCQFFTHLQAVTLCRSSPVKARKAHGTPGVCFQKLPSYFWRLQTCSVNYQLIEKRTLRDLWYCSMSGEASWFQLLCKRSRTMDRIPPASVTLKQHLLRASYQGGHVWSQLHLTLPELPSPAEWGWMKDGHWKPVWTTLAQAQESCYELIHCSCKKACRGLCKCTRANLQCTALCSCGGNGYN